MRKMHEPKTQDFVVGLGSSKSAGARDIRRIFASKWRDKASKLASRNAYRAAIGLPIIEK